MRTIFCFSSCNDLCVSRDGTTVVSGHLDCHLRFWDIKNGDCAHEITNLHTGQITSVSLSPGILVPFQPKSNILTYLTTM